MSVLPTGFKNLPISKYLICLTAVIPLISSLSSIKYVYYLSYTPFISQYKQFWRIITSQLSFINESEVLLAVIILYQYRALERLFSSYKFLSLLIVVWIYNVTVIASLVIVDIYLDGLIVPLDRFPSGPFGVITAFYAIYKNYIPVTYTFDIYSSDEYHVTLNDQVLLNLLTFQLVLSQGWSSIAIGFIGYTVGFLIINGFLPGKNWRAPLYHLITGWFEPQTQRFPESLSLNNNNDNGNGREVTPNEEEDEESRNARDDDDDDEDPAETRPLTSQFLDTFRR